MRYRVTATLKTETAIDLHRKLLDGTILKQKPDGRAIVDAMNRAVVKETGEVEFSMGCLCSTPLAHERATVFDKHFDDLVTEVVQDRQEHVGRPFMDYLAELSDPSRLTHSQ